MHFEESIKTTLKIHMPKSLSKHFSFLATCAVPDRIAAIFDEAFMLIDQYAKTKKEIKEGVHINFTIMDCDQLTMLFDDESSLGWTIHYIFYPIHKWKKKQLDDLQILTCILEEFCHGLWSISDEVEVKKHVVEIINLLPGFHIELNDLFIVKNGLPLLRDHPCVSLKIPLLDN